jgi:hypothetical protein
MRAFISIVFFIAALTVAASYFNPSSRLGRLSYAAPDPGYDFYENPPDTSYDI